MPQLPVLSQGASRSFEARQGFYCRIKHKRKPTNLPLLISKVQVIWNESITHVKPGLKIVK